MPFGSLNPPKTLPEWLAIATKDLVPSAQIRIRAEIEAHYAEAVNGHKDNGLSETEAQTAALADLGNAHAAVRRFRREYFTRKDLKYIALHTQVGSSLSIRFACLSLILFLCWPALSHHVLDNYASLSFLPKTSFMIIAGLPVIVVVDFILSRRTYNLPGLRRNLLVSLILFPFYGVLCLAIIWACFPLEFALFAVVSYVPMALCGGLTNMRLRKKLLGACENELTPLVTTKT